MIILYIFLQQGSSMLPGDISFPTVMREIDKLLKREQMKV